LAKPGVLRTGLRRPALLAAKPETGKSTLARQLAVAVSQGKPFLGRSTTRGAVLHWQTEDEVRDVSSAFTRLGSTDVDEQIYVFQGDPDSSGCEHIVAQLDQDPKINLVIIETLDDLLKIADIKENTAARQAFEKFTTQLIIPFGHRVSFLALHHMKKAETSFPGDGLLGASWIRGRTDAKIYLAQMSPDEETRIIWSTKRIGHAIPKTVLVFDPNTGRSELGETVADAKRNAESAAKTAARVKFEIVMRNPGIEHKDLLSRLDGGFKGRLNLINEAVLDDSILRSGHGRKGSPFTYTATEVPDENVSPNFEEKEVSNVMQ
jgi:hypothetical protein